MILYICKSTGKNLSSSGGAFREAFGKLSTLHHFVSKVRSLQIHLYIVYIIILCIKIHDVYLLCYFECVNTRQAEKFA